MLFDAGRDGEDVGVEDDVFGRKADFVNQDAVSALADLNLSLVGVRLALLIERHDDGGCTIALHQFGLVLEDFLAFFQADGVDDTFALHTLQSRFDDRPFTGVDHHRYARNVGLTRHEVQELDHGGAAVEHRLVHVDIDHLGTVFDLLARDGQGIFELGVQDETRESFGTGDVGAFADVDEQTAGINAQGLKAR